IIGLPPWAPLPPPAVLVVANCAFCQTDQPSTVPCPVKINDLQHERIGKIERDITALSRHSFPSTRRRQAVSACLNDNEQLSCCGRIARQVSVLRRFAPEKIFDESLRKQMRLPA